MNTVSIARGTIGLLLLVAIVAPFSAFAYSPVNYQYDEQCYYYDCGYYNDAYCNDVWYPCDGGTYGGEYCNWISVPCDDGYAYDESNYYCDYWYTPCYENPQDIYAADMWDWYQPQIPAQPSYAPVQQAPYYTQPYTAAAAMPNYYGQYGSGMNRYGTQNTSGYYPAQGIPTGRTDLIGTVLCNYPTIGYYGYECGVDPRQPVQDPYTGRWY